MNLRHLALAMLALTITQPAHSAPATPQLRIGLAKWFAQAPAVLLSSDKSYTIQDAATGKPLIHVNAGAVYRITPTSDGIVLTRFSLKNETVPAKYTSPVTFAPSSTDTVKIARIDPQSPSLAIHWHRYRGTLTISLGKQNTIQTVGLGKQNTLQVVNTVGLEPYLYGVIPAEIGSNVPLQAMRAQAVAARTYALKNRGKFATEGYDLDDTSRSEGYFGVDGETSLSNAAVDSTRNQVLTYHGALIDAPYSTDSGGMTACDTNGDCPYLQAVRDAPANGGPDYASGGKYHLWMKSFTPAEVAAKLAADPLTRVSQFSSLVIDGFDQSGRITTATIFGANGEMRTVPGPQLRRILGYDSLRSTRVVLTMTPEGNYQFNGKGWGHGLGMSQDGAVCMASPPYRKSCRDILQHYYVGTALTNIKQVNWDVSTAKKLP